jgi:tripartite-type tricarboxylate transporter receptor subunit TctC
MTYVIKYAIAAAVAATLAGPVALAQSYPTGTVTIVVPYNPAGSVDPVGRFVAGELQELWGKSVVVSNRPGAGATIGTAYVAKAPADGHTILLTSSAFTTSPAVYKKLPYDPFKDLVPVAMPMKSQFLLTVGSGIKSAKFADLLEEAKGRKLFMATAGLGASTHFAGELLITAVGINVEPVHYKGGNEVMIDLIGGRADLYVGSITALLSNVKAGKIRALAVLGASRATALPDVPSTEELGIKGVNSGYWLGVFVPAGTSHAIVAKLNKDITAVLTTNKGEAFLAKLDSSPTTLSPAEFSDLVKTEIGQWKELAKARGIAAD